MKNKILTMMKSLILLFVFIALNNCSKQNNEDNNPLPEPPVATNEVDFWLTKADQSVKIQKQVGILAFKDSYNNYPNIEVNDAQTFQTVEGFGFSLTGGS
ncbi:MAG TPA: glucosylceramidase, partial [Lutibacter sp.]|nr:glucosylceramidase [Lutibacter sp.]